MFKPSDTPSARTGRWPTHEDTKFIDEVGGRRRRAFEDSIDLYKAFLTEGERGKKRGLGEEVVLVEQEVGV